MAMRYVLRVLSALVAAALAPGVAAASTIPEPEATDLSSLELDMERSSDQSTTELSGIFEIDPGRCDNGGVTDGSYFRMIQPRGDAKNGPFINNGNSSCGDDTYTPMSPGDDGGLATGAYQPNPEPAFDGAGNAQASGIFDPLNFQGIDYGGSTNEVDPQTDAQVPPPSFEVDSSGDLTGDIPSISVAWNRQHFNQGAPKPDGSTPGLTKPPSGTYNSATGAFEMEWTSTINGGPFDGFTGLWHLEGTFVQNAEPSAPASSGTGSSSGSAAGEQQGGSSDAVLASQVGGAEAAGAAGTFGQSAKTLPNTGPEIVGWLAWVFLLNGLLWGAFWIRGLQVRRRV